MLYKYMYSLCCYRIIHPSLILQAAAKGSYTPLVDTLKQVDSVTKDDVVKVC